MARLARGKGDRHLLCEAPGGPLAAKGACHLFSGLILPAKDSHGRPASFSLDADCVGG